MRIDIVYTMAETLVTLRVPKELKEKMNKSRINWSEELRRAIRSKLEEDTKRSADTELERLLDGVKPGFDSLRAIKEARQNG